MSIWFRNNDTRYKIFDNWNDEDDSNEAGLEVETLNTKAKRLLDNQASVMSTLMRLNDYKKIKNEAHDE